MSKGIAVITGASAGIGACYADRLAKRGYDLLLVARRRDKLEEVAARLPGVKVEVEPADLSQSADVARLAQRLQDDPNITMLVNNAGIARAVGPTVGTPQDAAAMIALNISQLTTLTLSVLPGFVKRNRGTIVNVASVLAFGALPNGGVYSGTKGYIVNFSRALQSDLKGTEVHLQVVLPSATRTEIWTEAELKHLDPARLMEVDDLVDAALVGLDRGETFTAPSLHQEQLWHDLDQARTTLFANAHSGKPAERYLARS